MAAALLQLQQHLPAMVEVALLLALPLTLLLARELIAFGPTAEVLTDANWARAQRMREPFDEQAPLCEAQAEGHRHEHEHIHAHSQGSKEVAA